MKFDDTAYMIFREIQLEEEKSPLLTKIEQMFYSKLSELQKILVTQLKKKFKILRKSLSEYVK